MGRDMAFPSGRCFAFVYNPCVCVCPRAARAKTLDTVNSVLVAAVVATFLVR